MTTITTTTTITWHPANEQPFGSGYYLAALSECTRAVHALYAGGRWYMPAEYGGKEQVFPTHWAEMPQLVGTLRPIPEGGLF